MMPRRRGLRPHLLAAVVRSKAAERRSPLNGKTFDSKARSFIGGCGGASAVRSDADGLRGRRRRSPVGVLEVACDNAETLMHAAASGA